MKKCFYIIWSVSFCSLPVKAQKQTDYIAKGKDTIWCSNIEYKEELPKAFTSGDATLYISYVDLKGESNEIKNAEKAGVTGFSKNGMDFIYMKVTNKKIWPPLYFWKKVSGTATLFVKGGQETPATYYVEFNLTDKIIKLPNGTSIELSANENDSKVESKLKPLFEQCPKIKEIFSGKVTANNVDYIVDIYNSFCGKDDLKTRDYIVKNKKDTVYVKCLQYDRDMGNIRTIAYLDNSGKQINIKGKGECESISSFSFNGYHYILLPQDGDKPDGYKMHIWRKINGKIKIYEYSSKASNSSESAWVHEALIEFPDGKIYNVSKKNVEKLLKPYIIQCPDFKNIYKGEFSPDSESIEQMVKLYNSVCK